MPRLVALRPFWANLPTSGSAPYVNSFILNDIICLSSVTLDVQQPSSTWKGHAGLLTLRKTVTNPTGSRTITLNAQTSNQPCMRQSYWLADNSSILMVDMCRSTTKFDVPHQSWMLVIGVFTCFHNHMCVQRASSASRQSSYPANSQTGISLIACSLKMCVSTANLDFGQSKKLHTSQTEYSSVRRALQ